MVAWARRPVNPFATLYLVEPCLHSPSPPQIMAVGEQSLV